MTKYINDFILNYLYHKKLDSMQLVDTKESDPLDLLNDVYVLKLAKRKLHRAIVSELKPKSRRENVKTIRVPADFDSDSDDESNSVVNAGEDLSCANMTVLQMISGKQSPSSSETKQQDAEKEEADLTDAPVEEEEQTESDADDEASEKEEDYKKMDKLQIFEGIGFALERFKQSIFSMWVSLF